MKILPFIVATLLSTTSLFAEDGETGSLKFTPESQMRFAEIEIGDGLPESFDQDPHAEGSASYFQFQYGDESSRTVCIKYDSKAPNRIFVDTDRDQKFANDELVECDEPGTWFVELKAEYGQLPYKTDQQRVRVRHDKDSSKWYVATAGLRVGNVSFSGILSDARLEDRNANGLWFDREDRLFVDFNRDGKISRLTERIPAQGMRKIRGKMYAVVGTDSGRSVSLTEVQGSGFLNAKIEFLDPGATISSVSGLLGSRAGIGIPFESIEQPIEVPVGDWHLESLRFAIDSEEGVFQFAFARSGNKTLISVADGESHELDLLGDLELLASVSVQQDKERSSLVITPNLTTGSGCYLVASKMGKRSAVNENRLMAFSASPQASLENGSSGFS